MAPGPRLRAYAPCYAHRVKAAPIPADEERRLAALLSYEILDTPAELVFDDLTRLASQISGCPIALVSLVDAERQWFKSRYGLEAPETPRDISFCGHVVAEQQALEVNALDDPRFVDNPLVTSAPHIRFYAGQPLTTPAGLSIGTLCVIDQRPRTLDDVQRSALEALSRQVVAQLELRRHLLESGSMASIVAASDEPMFSVSRSGQLRVWNAAARRVLGWTGPELQDRGLSALDARHATSVADLVDRVLAGHKVERAESVCRSPEGRRIDVAISLSPTVDPSGELTGVVGVLHDIGERKRVERIKNELLSTVSHELRTPLTSIRGSLGLLLGGVQGEFPPAARRLLELANDNAERLIRMVSKHLDLEKIEAGRFDLDLTRADAQGVFAAALDSGQGFAARHGVTLTATSTPAPGVTVSVDTDAFARIMDNLLSNALKHSSSAAVVELTATSDGDRLVCGVHDRGPGIPADFRHRVFERFSQADGSDTREPGGTGLGLAICRGLAREMGGEVWFEDREGGGTSFFFSVPRALEVEPRASAGAK